MLKFSNPGEIDVRLITTMGVNVKDNDSPIGYFGTGLKYAIACCVRMGVPIQIWSGATRYDFESWEETVRGKSFGFIYMNGERLGFTSDLGKTWEPWMVYRELMSNAIDEGGRVDVVPLMSNGAEGHTVIFVDGLGKEHIERGKIFLSTPPRIITEIGEIHDGGAQAAFYRGVRVFHWGKPAMFTYNITQILDLTEDRTAKYYWEPAELAARMIVLSEDREVIKRAVMAIGDYAEAKFEYDKHVDGKVFDEVVAELMKTNLGTINPSAITRVKHRRPKVGPRVSIVTGIEQKQLVRAFQALSGLGITINCKVNIAEDLGDCVTGCAYEGEIYISRASFDKGTKFVTMVLLEEWMHAEKGIDDYTRRFQNFCLEKIMSLLEQLQGEPL